MGAIFKEGFSFSGFERDMLKLNLGSGRFLDVSSVSGADSISDGRGAVFADFDNDGDTDIFLTAVQNEAHFLYRNNVGSENNFIRVSLRGSGDAFGATVRVKTSAGILTKIKTGGSGFVSQHDPRLLFGLGKDRRAEWVEVTWPGGGTTRHEGVPAGSSLELVHGRDDFTLVAERRFSLVDPLGEEDAALARLGIRHGDRFPDLELRTLDDRPARLSDLIVPGRRTLVNFWATYCVPCAREMPELQRLHASLEASGIGLVGVSIDMETVDQVPAYLAERGIEYPVYTTVEESIPRVFTRGEVMIPMSVLLDDRRRVIELHTGWTEGSRGAIRGWIGDAAGG